MFQISLIFIFPKILHAYHLYWYIGAAFIKPSKEIVKLFENKNKDADIILIPGGSQILLQKILLSKKADLYMPGAEFYEKAAAKKGVVLKSVDFIKQTPVFGISKNAEKRINNLYDLCKKDIKIALGNDKTMALGKLYKKIEKNFPERLKNCIEENCVIKAINVAQIANYIKMNVVDAGILFKSVAKVFHIKIINIPEKYLVVDRSPLILLKFSKNREKADKFFNFILKNKNIFKKYGYQTCF